MKKYKISKTYVADKFCSKYGEYYLLEDENGQALIDLFDKMFNLTLMIINYHSLINLQSS
jgi:hypothetical protein